METVYYIINTEKLKVEKFYLATEKDIIFKTLKHVAINWLEINSLEDVQMHSLKNSDLFYESVQGQNSSVIGKQDVVSE